MNSEKLEGPAGLSYSDPQREVIKQAEELKKIWDNPYFGGMLQQVSSEITEELFATGDDETAARERLFWKSKGLAQLAEAFIQRIRQADAVMQESQSAEMQLSDRLEKEEDSFD